MLTCPMCKKTTPVLERECPNCRADLSLLVGYVEDLEDGLTRAERLTREGNLGEAVFAYLSVLEVDPDNTEARRQVGQVVASVRQFDRSAPSRRWLKSVQRQHRFRRWSSGWGESGGERLLNGLLWGLLMLAALLFGYLLGRQSERPTPVSAVTYSLTVEISDV